jgi:predicted DNA-binding protein (MmcQ/YjbR family)
LPASKKDPTESIRAKASRYPAVDEGTACTQSSFKTGNKAFLFIGMQGGRYKAMFKLEKSKPAAIKLAKKDPDCYAVGSTAWVTARFTADKPMPKKLWEKWLDESYQLTFAAGAGKKTTKKKTIKKKTAKKKAKPKTRRN